MLAATLLLAALHLVSAKRVDVAKKLAVIRSEESSREETQELAQREARNGQKGKWDSSTPHVARALSAGGLVAPNLLSDEAKTQGSFWHHQWKYAGWSYSDKLQGPERMDNIYMCGSSKDKFMTTLRTYQEMVTRRMFLPDAQYREALVWFEDTGRSALARVVPEEEPCAPATVRRCSLSKSMKLCTRSWDDPSPWCAQAGQKTLLAATVPSNESSAPSVEYTWDQYLGFMNKPETPGMGVSTDGSLGPISHESYAGPFAQQKYPMPVLAGRLAMADPNRMPITRADAHFTTSKQALKLPVAMFGRHQIRTGIAGKGQLGRWGPNFAADPVVTRWNPIERKFQVAMGVRGDSGQYALPGGMKEPGDDVTSTVLKEFIEEVMGNMVDDFRDLASTCFQKAASGEPGKSGNTIRLADCMFLEMMVACIHHPERATSIYRGIVDDPRNTDNAWMETDAVWIHINDCEPGPLAQASAGNLTLSDPLSEHSLSTQIANSVELTPATDVSKARFRTFTDIDLDRELYASHGYMLRGLQKYFKNVEAA